MAGKKIAVVGATGLVGRELLKILEQSNFPIKEIQLFASPRSQNKIIIFKGREYTVKVINEDDLKDTDIVFCCAKPKVAKEVALLNKDSQFIMIDNSRAFRLKKDVPLVVPEVNREEIIKQKGIIANPNCSTIQLTVSLAPLKKFGIKRVVVSTYQAVSGAGQRALEEFQEQIHNHKIMKKLQPQVFPYHIFANLIPQIGEVEENKYTKEEMKMVHETRKILQIPELPITATCVRVPVFYGHSESVNVTLNEDINEEDIIAAFQKAAGIKLFKESFPVPTNSELEDQVLIGRIRKDYSKKNSINFWSVANNIRKGAALNAVQIAENIEI